MSIMFRLNKPSLDFAKKFSELHSLDFFTDKKFLLNPMPHFGDTEEHLAFVPSKKDTNTEVFAICGHSSWFYKDNQQHGPFSLLDVANRSVCLKCAGLSTAENSSWYAFFSNFIELDNLSFDALKQFPLDSQAEFLAAKTEQLFSLLSSCIHTLTSSSSFPFPLTKLQVREALLFKYHKLQKDKKVSLLQEMFFKKAVEAHLKVIRTVACESLSTQESKITHHAFYRWSKSYSKKGLGLPDKYFSGEFHDYFFRQSFMLDESLFPLEPVLNKNDYASFHDWTAAEVYEFVVKTLKEKSLAWSHSLQEFKKNCSEKKVLLAVHEDFLKHTQAQTPLDCLPFLVEDAVISPSSSWFVFTIPYYAQVLLQNKNLQSEQIGFLGALTSKATPEVLTAAVSFLESMPINLALEAAELSLREV